MRTTWLNMLPATCHTIRIRQFIGVGVNSFRFLVAYWHGSLLFLLDDMTLCTTSLNKIVYVWFKQKKKRSFMYGLNLRIMCTIQLLLYFKWKFRFWVGSVNMWLIVNFHNMPTRQPAIKLCLANTIIFMCFLGQTTALIFVIIVNAIWLRTNNSHYRLKSVSWTLTVDINYGNYAEYACVVRQAEVVL